MFKSLLSNQRNCPEINQNVRIDQDEKTCRKQHGCEQVFCPLNREFKPDKLDFIMALTGMNRK